MYGQLRKFKHCFPSIKKFILDEYNPDVYICTDYISNYVASVGAGANDGTYQEALDLYQPVSTITAGDKWPVKNNVNLEGKRASDSTNIERLSHFLLKKFLVGGLCSMTNIQYDCIVCCRFDLEFFEKPALSQQIGITIPSGQDFLRGINDQLAWGEQKAMNYYMALIRKAEEYCNSGVLVHPETLLAAHLQAVAMPVQRVDLKYQIVR